MKLLDIDVQIREALKIKARHKYVTYALNKTLLSVPGINFKEEKRFNRTLECNGLQNFTIPGTLTSRYCNSRACLVCSRARSKMYMAKYLDTFNTFDDPVMLTLTFQNVKAHELKSEVQAMVKNFQKSKDCLRKEKIFIRGLRKLEVTYNDENDTYHPHYHIMIDHYGNASRIKDRWEDQYNGRVSEYAQNIRSIDQKGFLELFKYFAKIFKRSKKTGEIEFNAPSLVNILRSLEHKRIVQPFGIKSKILENEDIEEEISDKILFNIDKNVYLWEQNYNDWLGLGTGEILTQYEPTEAFKKFSNIFDNGKT